MRRRVHILTFLFLYYARLVECIRVETNTNLQPFHHHFSSVNHHRQPIQPQPTVIYRPFAYPISVLDGEAYLVNGRFVKQYAVMEHIPNDVAYPSDLFAPFFVDGFNGIDGTSNNYLDGGIFHHHLPLQDGITLGSGSLGYIQLDNGEIFLGSGSLGFISTKERNLQILQARMRKSPPPGPFSFGSAPSQLSS